MKEIAGFQVLHHVASYMEDRHGEQKSIRARKKVRDCGEGVESSP